MRNHYQLGLVVIVVMARLAAGCGGRMSTEDRDFDGGTGGASSGGSGGAGTGGTCNTGTCATGGASSGGSGGAGTGGTCNTGTCGTGGTSPGGSGGSGAGGAGGTATTDAGSAQCGPFISPSICSMNPTGQVVTQTLGAFRQHISARWVLCGKESVFGKDRGDIGLELLADGRWFKLYAGPAGATVRGAGFDEEGTWEVIDVGQTPDQPFQLNLGIFGSGTVITHPAFAAMPPAMRLSNIGVFVGNYVLDPTVPTSAIRCR